MSALAQIDLQRENEAVAGVEQATSVIERIAIDLEVRDDVTAAQAEQLLQRIARELKAHEAARVELVKPLNDHVRAINQRFKSAVVPAERARRLVGDKLLAYRAEQDRRRREAEEAERRRREAEQRRLEEERRAAEARARAEREAAAREAARREAEAREAERRRLEQMRRAADALRTRIARLDDDELRQLAGRGSDDERAAARAELEVRAAARRAKEAAAAARQREEEARLAEQAAREAPAPVAPPQPAPAPAPRSSAVATRRVWRARIVDEHKVPREYLRIDMAKINQAVRQGVRSIPGVEIRQHDELAVRSAA